MKLSKHLSIILSFIIGAILGITVYEHLTYDELKEVNYNTLPYKIEVIKAYDTYYSNCEALLDSINNVHPMYDDIMETDTYYFYELSKEKVDSLNNLD